MHDNRAWSSSKGQFEEELVGHEKCFTGPERSHTFGTRETG